MTTENAPLREVKITIDDKGFVYASGIKFGRRTPQGFEIKGRDRRKPGSPVVRVVVPIDQLIRMLGEICHE